MADRTSSSIILPQGLPAHSTLLIGREDEVASIVAQLRAGVRLLTLTGPGGTGKTRLAAEVATRVAEAYEDGVFFVALALVHDPELVPGAIAQVLGAGESGNKAPADALREYLRRRHMLLVLDNFEQVVSAAPLVAGLLQDAPDLTVLVTSRERLHLADEQIFDVPPLPAPDPRTLPEDRIGLASALREFEAVRLFVERAKAVEAGFALTQSNAPAIAEICYRLDGLPLAIELAAARVRLLPPQALLTRLKRGLHLLAGSPDPLPARQQTLRGTIAWSYDLLPPDEQDLFRRLGIFAGGCTPEAAAAVCRATVGGLRALADKSLLRHEPRSEGNIRFFMLDTIREYALERLRDSPEAGAVREQHARYFRTLAEQAEPELTGPRQQQWLARLAEEHDNLRAALTWALDRTPGELALRLATSLWRYWHTRGHLAEGIMWLQAAVTKGVDASPDLRAKGLFAIAALSWAQGDYTTAQTAGEASLVLRRELGEIRDIAASLNVLGLLHQELNDHVTARTLLEESLALCRQMGDPRGIGVTLLNLGETARALGDYATARRSIEESIDRLRSVGDTRHVASALGYLGNVACDQQEYLEAHALLVESLGMRWTVRDMNGIARTLAGIAGIVGALSGDATQAARAVRLFGAADAVRTAIGVPIPRSERIHYDRDLEHVRAQLDAPTFDESWAAGRTLPVEQAIAEAQQSLITAPAAAGS